jgi:hypothetical protein
MYGFPRFHGSSHHSGILPSLWFSAVIAGLGVGVLVGTAEAQEEGPPTGAESWSISTPWQCLSANHRCIKYDHDSNQIGEPIDGCGSMSGYYATADVTTWCTT